MLSKIHFNTFIKANLCKFSYIINECIEISYMYAAAATMSLVTKLNKSTI